MRYQKMRSWLFVIAITAAVLILGRIVGGRQGLLIAFAIALILNSIALAYAYGIILWTYNARPLDGSDPYGLNHMVEQLALRAAIPKPKLYVLPTQTPNAFSLGYSPKSAAIAISEGAIKIMDKHELEAILAHEITHIQNHDTLLLMMAATMGSIVMYVAQFFRWLARFGRPETKVHQPGSTVGMIMDGILAPVSAILVQTAANKNREYVADWGARNLTGQPEALAQALWKMHHYSESKPLPATFSTAHLFIINPLSGRGVSRLFSTHPPVDERIKRLTGKAP